MGTVSEKLVYLNGTKQAIKQAINEDFEVIDNNTTFREYADEISSNNAKYKDLIPKETKNATNTLDISNSAGLDKALVTQYGNTYQETTTGKNLFVGYDNMQIGFLPASGNYPTTNSSYPDARYQLIELKQGESISTSGSTSAFGRIRLIDKDTNKVAGTIIDTENDYYSSTVNYVSEFKTGTITAKKDIILGILILRSVFADNFQIEKGTTTTPYEPYTGGNPAPNPDYPQDIQVVSGDNTIKVEGKNLIGLGTQLNGYVDQSTLKFQTSPSFIGYYFETSKLPNTITFSSINGNRANVCYFDEIPALSVVAKLRSASNNNPRTITVDKTYPYVHIQFSYNNKNVTNIQIESGSSATTYDPYQSQSYAINLGDIELCKIGNYKDYIFKNTQDSPHYDNTLIEDAWYLNKQIGKVVLDGSEIGWSSRAFPDNNYLSVKRTLNNNANGGYCDNFISNNQYDVVLEHMTISKQWQECAFAILKSRLSTPNTEGFKAWLGTHNTIAYYVLATPTTEEITENNYPTLYNQLNNIKLFEGVNHITMTNESGLDVDFDITYYKDWKLD